jgi:hypothetical protein
MTDLFKLILGILASRFKARATLEAENVVVLAQVFLSLVENLENFDGPFPGTNSSRSGAIRSGFARSKVFERRVDRLPALAAEMVRRQVAVRLS